MANNLQANPLRVDTAATIINAKKYVQALEWVSDSTAAGGAMAAADTLIMTVNGVPVNLLCVIALTQTWVITFPQPIEVGSLIVTTIDGGTLLIWLA